mmetsp:Transcript_735/g.1759  ORF Transcript_735/g.1759 Transcript_735/m.1759 type:complete len:99 (-) Transcript_735:31-327(-)
MKINTELERWVHLFVLIAFSALGGWAIARFLEWTPLAAFGLACTVTCQVNNAMHQLMNSASDDDDNDQKVDNDTKTTSSSKSNNKNNKKRQKKIKKQS